ncbi:hypothetical protein JW824_02485 [bacterium]|nr:hypothetical protein [bacterium]RQV93274.1 MAG: hypothetical protein EH221_09880 [bacterium]
MSVGDCKRKFNPVGIVTLFRVFLWWGTEVVKQVLTHRKPEAKIVHMLRSESVFPVSKWVFTDKMTCCIVSVGTEAGVDIHRFHQASKN